MVALKPGMPSHMHEATATREKGRRSRRVTFILIGSLTVVILVLTAGQQIFDTNFYTLWEATALLAGDHPYRDFYEWGVPLQATLSAVAQVGAGHRLIGEFVVHWLFIVAGVVVAFHLAIRLSHSIAASLITMLLALAILAATPTFHYPKLFLYPLAVWVGWRYIERPDAIRSGILGLVTAVAFLFRHDHGLYSGGLALVAFCLARLAAPASRNVRSALADGATYCGAAAAVLAPWLMIVHLSEGVPEYIRMRAGLYREWSAKESPYRTLLTMNPVRVLSPEKPAPKPAVVSFEWTSNADEARRKELEQRYRLRLIRDRTMKGNGATKFEMHTTWGCSS